jgi:ADP-ribosylation factor family
MDFAKRILSRLGGIFRRRPKVVVVLGLTNVAKRMNLAFMELLDDEPSLANSVPILHADYLELIAGNMSFRAYKHKERIVWKDVAAIVYAIDALNKERFPAVKIEIEELRADKGLVGIPCCFIGIDVHKPLAASEQELREIFEFRPPDDLCKYVNEEADRSVFTVLTSLLDGRLNS